jgi:predicted Zn finger-like uncharacterized protein
MSLATRCPHCGTAFKLVRDQLRLRQGWVRCGRCGEAFDAVEHQFEHAPKPDPLPETPGALAIASSEPVVLPKPPQEVDQNHADGASFSPTPAAAETVPAVDAPTLALADSDSDSDSEQTAAPLVLALTPSLPSVHPDHRAAMAAVLPPHAAAAHADQPSASTHASSPWQSGAFAYAPSAAQAWLVADRPLPQPLHATEVPEKHAEPSQMVLAPSDGLAQSDGSGGAPEKHAGPPQVFLTPSGGLEQSDGSGGALKETPGRSQVFLTPTGGESASRSWDAQHQLPASEDDGLATFSAEAEAALHQADPASQTVQTATTTEHTEPSAELLRAAEAEARQVQADFGARPQADIAETPALVASASIAEADVANLATTPAAAEVEADSRFDIGSALHYVFGPDYANDPPPGMAAQGPSPAGLEANSHAESGAIATDLPGGAVIEPRFLRQARAQERWRQPGVRTGLSALAALLIALGSVQAAWTWHDELAAGWPQTRPALTRLCAVAGCTLDAPRKLQSLVLDTSSMAPASNGLLQLNASLRNRSGEAVAYPALELTLTGTQDQIEVRKIILPVQYLAIGKLARDAAALQRHVQQGLVANGEQRIQLQLQLSQDQASGYTLAVFYP